jgi:hypothetical protein
MTDQQIVRVVERVYERVTEYAQPAAQPTEPGPAELQRGYDPLTDSPLAGTLLRYEGEPTAEPREHRGWWPW